MKSSIVTKPQGQQRDFWRRRGDNVSAERQLWGMTWWKRGCVGERLVLQGLENSGVLARRLLCVSIQYVL